MAITGTVEIPSAVQTAFDADYYHAVQAHLYFDQFSDLKFETNGVRGRTVQWDVIERLEPSTAMLDEYLDVVPQAMRQSPIQVTLAEYGGAVELTRFVVATAYTDVLQAAAEANGLSMAESVDYIVRAVVGQGSRVFYQNNHTARSQFAGPTTAADRATPAFIERLVAYARALRMPLFDDGAVATILHPFVFYDLLQNTGVRDLAIRSAPELLFNGELAYWGGLRICVSVNAKAFWGEGAAPTNGVATTLAAAVQPGDTQMQVASAANIAVGQWLAIRDAPEPGNTWSDTNELFYVTGVSGTTISGFCFDPGPGDGGGFRYRHAVGTAVNNNASVYQIPILGPQSVTKVASDLTGPYGETIIGPVVDRLMRFKSIGWYLIAGWARTRAGWLPRGECGAAES